VQQQQEQSEISSNAVVNSAIGIILEGLNAFAWDNSLVSCSIGGISASDGAQVLLIGNQVILGGYGFRLARLNESSVQLNVIRGANVGIIIDGDNTLLYITDNFITNCTSHAIRVNTANDGIYVAHNRLLYNNGAGTVYSSTHIQVNDQLGFANWNQTGDWGNYWSDWTSSSYSIGAYNISTVAQDSKPYPMLRCGPPASLTGKFTGNNLTITWTAPTYPGFQEATSYAIYRGNSVDNMTRIGTVAGTVSTFTDYGLGASTYFYQISAINDYGEGSRSGVLEAAQGSSGGIDMTLLLIAVLLVLVALVIVVLVTRKRR
jgi:hypothetical protein